LKELRIPSIVLSTKETKEDMLLLIGKEKYKLVFRRQQRTFGYKIPKYVID